MKPQTRQTRAKILNLFMANDSARGSNSLPGIEPYFLAAIQRERLIVLRLKIDSAFRSRIDEVLHLRELLQALRAEQRASLHFKAGALRLQLLILDLKLTQLVAGHQAIRARQRACR